MEVDGLRMSSLWQGGDEAMTDVLVPNLKERGKTRCIHRSQDHAFPFPGIVQVSGLSFFPLETMFNLCSFWN